MIAVVVTDVAEEQLRDIVDWWQGHREASPSLVMDEFDRCVALLESSPDLGPRFRRSRVPGVRRLLMRRTKHHVYYLHDEPNAVVYVLSVWGSPKLGYSYAQSRAHVCWRLHVTAYYLA